MTQAYEGGVVIIMCVCSENFKLASRHYYDSFQYNGKEYKLGTQIVLKDEYYKKITDLNGKSTYVIQHFTTGSGKHGYYIFRKYGPNNETIGYQIEKDPNEWIEEIVECTDTNNDMFNKPVEHYKDSEDGDVMFGWVVYILLMLVFIIFNDGIIFWSLTSAIFFTWRNKKLRKE